MEFQIKEEPLEFTEATSVSQSRRDEVNNFIEAQYNAERYYLDNFDSMFSDCDTEQFLMEQMEVNSSNDCSNDNINDLISKRNDFLITDALQMIQISSGDSAKNKVFLIIFFMFLFNKGLQDNYNNNLTSHSSRESFLGEKYFSGSFFRLINIREI